MPEEVSVAPIVDEPELQAPSTTTARDRMAACRILIALLPARILRAPHAYDRFMRQWASVRSGFERWQGWRTERVAWEIVCRSAKKAGVGRH